MYLSAISGKSTWRALKGRASGCEAALPAPPAVPALGCFILPVVVVWACLVCVASSDGKCISYLSLHIKSPQTSVAPNTSIYSLSFLWTRNAGWRSWALWLRASLLGCRHGVSRQPGLESPRGWDWGGSTPKLIPGAFGKIQFPCGVSHWEPPLLPSSWPEAAVSSAPLSYRSAHHGQPVPSRGLMRDVCREGEATVGSPFYSSEVSPWVPPTLFGEITGRCECQEEGLAGCCPRRLRTHSGGVGVVVQTLDLVQTILLLETFCL